MCTILIFLIICIYLKHISLLTIIYENIYYIFLHNICITYINGYANILYCVYTHILMLTLNMNIFYITHKMLCMHICIIFKTVQYMHIYCV